MGILDNLEAYLDRKCDKCKQSFDEDLFWDTHQTMTDSKVWCAK